MVAPEQAKEMNVTDVWGAARSISNADCAGPALAERWQRRSCHTAGVVIPFTNTLSNVTAGRSGLPSPEP